MAESISDIIVRTDTKGKILDFRNNLILARKEHYAMMHGTGGKEFAPNSTIKVTVTDYSNGTGDKSTTVSANVSPDLIARILDVCRQNVGVSVVPPSSGKGSSSEPINPAKIEEAYKLALELFQKGAQGADKGSTVISKESLRNLGVLIAETKDAIAAHNGKSQSAQPSPSVQANASVDFSWQQERVNIYGDADKEGRIPVSVLTIVRQQYRKNGDVSRLPWSAKITTFRAKPKAQENGTTAYDGNSKADVKEAYINISDDEMFRCCYRIERFIQVWENAMCIPLVREGISIKEQNRLEYNANRT